MRRLLIVSPHFPPINAPDHQRIRMSLPYFREFGWEPVVVAVQPSEVEGLEDPTLVETVPTDIEVHRVGALPIKYTRPFGFGSLALRALPHLNRCVRELMVQNPFDVAYFSTTMFATMSLGRKWKTRYGLPYVLDFQDPWLSDYEYSNGKTPPGGKLKYRFSQSIAKTLEPYSVRDADHIISVSPAYPEVLMQRYDFLTPDKFTVMPFGAPEIDFDFVRKGTVTQGIFDPQDGNRHYVYIGRGGDDMARALNILFAAIADLRRQNAADWKNVRLHFIGTSYAQGNRAEKSIEPVAKKFGVDDLVHEHVHRIPYHAAIRAMLDSDGILLIGSDDPSYTASKLYPCILAKRPVLAIFHERSSVVSITRDCNAGVVVTFSGEGTDMPSAAKPAVEWLVAQPRQTEPSTNWSAFEQYTARAMTAKQCAIFDAVASNAAAVAGARGLVTS